MLPRLNLSVPVLRPAAKNWSRSETLIVFRVPRIPIDKISCTYSKKFNHSIGERRAPEVSIKAPPHLRSALQFATEVFAPALFIIERRAGKIRIREKFRRAQSIIDSLTGYRIGETGRIAQQRPPTATRAAGIPSARRKTWNASRIAFGATHEFIPNLIVFSALLSFPNLHPLEHTHPCVRTAGILAGQLFATTSRFVITHHEIP